MSYQAYGLIIFAVCVAVNAMGLAIDAALKENGFESITDFTRRNQWLAALIILFNIVGLVGLAMHFSNGK